MKKVLASIIAMAFALMIPICSLAETIDYVISQAYQEKEDDTRLHIRVESTGAVAGKPLVLTKDDIREATLGTGDTPVLDVFSVQDARAGGMSYVFVLDHAMPINGTRMDEMKTGMKNWIQAMGEDDQVAILVVEENEVRNVTQGFTGDQNAMLESLEDYGKAVENPSKNMVYSGIREAILMASTDVSARPRNCSVVVFSNGADTYQTRVTLSEISELLTKNNLPLYVVGFAYSQQKNALATLVEVAKNSGGWAEDATPSNDAGPIDEAFDRLRMRICNGYDITLDCSDGFVTNGLMTVALNLSNPEVLLKRNVELYLLEKDDDETVAPVESVSNNATNTVEEKTDYLSAFISKAETVIHSAAEMIKDQTPLLIEKINNPIILGIILFLFIILVLWRVSRHKAKKLTGNKVNTHVELENNANIMTERDTPPETNSEKEVTTRVRDPKIEEGGTIRGNFSLEEKYITKLIIQYRLPYCDEMITEFESPTCITIGRNQGNSLVLQDKGVSSWHAKITCKGTQVELENTSSEYNGKKNRLIVNGIDVSEKRVIENDCRIEVASIPLRVRWTISETSPIYITNSDDLTVRDPEATVRAKPINLIATYYTDDREESVTLPLLDRIVIGRDEHCQICISDPSISRTHLTIIKNENHIMISNTSWAHPFHGKNPIYYGSKAIDDAMPIDLTQESTTLYLGSKPIKLVLRISGMN